MSETPPRRAGSVRRTTTHDCTRPEGLEGPVTMVARGRDLLTRPDSDAALLDFVRIDTRVASGIIERISAVPSVSGLTDLGGTNALSGFRARVQDAMPAECRSGSVRFQLLDDLPVALMLSARALRAAGIGLDMGAPHNLPIDICAGWVAGGTLVEGLTVMGPPLDLGPVASPLTRDDDTLAWHDFEKLPAHSTRRHRRIDVWQNGTTADVDCFFRDSFIPADGIETVVHQYRIRGTVDPETSRFLTCKADAGPLPYPECPNALGSASRLAGAQVSGLRREVRKSFLGPSTCTHLNDTLRSLEDVAGLITVLRRAQMPSN